MHLRRLLVTRLGLVSISQRQFKARLEGHCHNNGTIFLLPLANID